MKINSIVKGVIPLEQVIRYYTSGYQIGIAIDLDKFSFKYLCFFLLMNINNPEYNRNIYKLNLYCTYRDLTEASKLKKIWENQNSFKNFFKRDKYKYELFIYLCRQCPDHWWAIGNVSSTKAFRVLIFSPGV